MAATTVIGAAEMAAEYMYHYLIDSGAVGEEAIINAEKIYKHITDRDLNTKEVLGLSIEDLPDDERILD